MFLSFSIAGTDITPSRVFGETRTSTLFHFEVQGHSLESVPPVADLTGAACELTITDVFDRSLTVRGIATSVRRVPGADGGAAVAAVIEPDVAALAVGRDHRLFQEMNVEDVIKKVLEKAAVDQANVRWSTTASYPKRPYWVQYGESDWAFIERLCAEHGIYYWFDFTPDATVLVFADDSSAAPELEEGAEIPYNDSPALAATRDSVTRVRVTHRLTTDKVTLRAYDHEKPRVDLTSSSGEDGREVYDFPGRFTQPADGDLLARVRLEGLRARRKVVSGESSSTRLRAGLLCELTEHPIDSLAGPLFLDGVVYRAEDLRGDVGASLLVTFTAIPKDTPCRPPVREVLRSTGGPQTGVVVGASGEEIHPDNTGRIRVQHYWDREGQKDDKASTWMRVGQFALGGSMIIPRIGWDVLVGHHENDADQPMVLTHLYDGQFPVPYALPANKTRTAWQTATTPGGGSTNEVRFEDKAGSEEIFVNASRDMNVVIDDTKTETIGVSSEETIGSNLDIHVGSNLKTSIKSNQDISVGASESLTVSGSRNVNVGGSETSTIGASRTVTAIKGSNIDATGGRTVTVGGSMIAVSAMGVNRLVLGSLSATVGGAWIGAAATGLAALTGGASAETVGGAKILAGASGVETSVKGAAAETVGGAYVIAAAGKAGETSTGPLAITVGGAFLANAPSIEIEAESEISIRVGGSSLTIKSSSIEVKAPTIAAPAGAISKDASKIEHN